MATHETSCSSGGDGGGSPPRVSPPKVVVDDSPLQPAMGKHKESLKVKLMMRRPINQLVEQGIMPPSKTPAVFFEQYKQLERAKTGDLLKAKIQRRPDRQELERRHILEQESHVDPSLAEKQRMLKKARLADQLNDQLSHRPGPLELIKKNILHTEETIETAVKSGVLAFKATSEGATGRPQHPSQYCGPPEEISPSPSPPSTLSPISVASPPQHPAPGKDKKKKSKPKQQPKARFKFHEYKGPPNAQKPASPPGGVQTPYELLLQQQQLLLQLMMPASPAMSVASVTSDSSDSHAPPPPPLPPTPAQIMLPSRFEDMKVSDLRAECKRRNLRVSGPKPQLLDRLRPYLVEKQIKQEEPRSPASVASVSSISSVDVKPKIEPQETVTSTTTATDMTQSLEELERKLEASRQQLEQMRREAANAPASDQSRRLLQAHLCVTQLQAQLNALQQPQNNQPPPQPQRYVIAASDLFSPADNNSQAKVGNSYILNGVKVVPIAILPSYEPERPTPPPPPPLPTQSVHELSEDSQIMDDVLELLVENGELPASAVDDSTANIDTTFLDTDIFSPEDVLNSGVLDTNARDTVAADELQRELDHIQQEIMSGATENERGPEIDPDLSVDMLTSDGYHTFGNSDPSEDADFLTGLLSSAGERHTAMETDEVPERTSVTPLTNGDILEPARPNFDDMDDLSLPSFQNEDTRPDTFEERPCELDLKEFGIDLGPAMHVDGYDYMDTQLIPNLFGRGHVPQCDPLLGGVVSHPAPRPASKHYSWDRIEFDAT